MTKKFTYKILFYLLAFLILGASIAFAAPTYRIERTIIPESNNLYLLGTSTAKWNDLWTTNINGAVYSTSSVSFPIPYASTTGFSFSTSGASGLLISSSSGTWTWSQATSTGSQNGFLLATDWTTFNNKQATITFPLSAASTTDFWTLSGTSLYPTSTTYNVGIGTTTPAYALDVVGRLSLKGTPPTISDCGTGPATSTNISDSAGTVTEGAVATGCTITFAAQFVNTPVCILQSEAGLVFSDVVTTSSIVITNIGALSSTKISYFCVGK